MSEISNNREYYINQLKILNPELDCSKLSDEQLRKQYEELQSALNKGSNWGKVGDAVEIVNPQSINNPNPPQLKKHILPEITPEQSIPKLTEEVAQEVALQNLSAINSELDYAIRDEKDRNNDVSEMLFIEGKGIEYLEKTRSSEGLTVKQYLQGLRDDVKYQIKILYPNLDENKINLDERLNTLDIDQLKGFERGLINAGLGRIDKAEVLRSFAESTQSVVTSKGTSDVSISNTIKNIKQPYIPSNGDDLMSFEQVYRIERGVEFNSDKIRQYLIDGTVNFYSDPFENGLDIERFNKDMEYRNRFPQSYIQAFGQPYRAEYNTVLKNSHFDTNSAYGVEQVKLNSDLKYDNEGTSYVIPTRDLTYNQEQRELNPQELKRFAANTLYNTLNNAYMILRQYHDGIYDQLSAGSVGAGAIQGFQRALGMDTVNDKLDQIGNLLNKARNLKDLNDNEFNKRFDEIFGQITGESFNPEYMLKFAQLTIKGVKADSDEYDNAVTKAFGKNITGDIEKGLDNLSLPASITDIVAFLSGSEVLGSTKLFQIAGTKSFQITAKIATRLGFNPVSKGVQTGVRLLSSSPVSAANMITYAGITEIGGTAMNSLAERINIKKSAMGEYMSVLDKVDKSLLDDDMIRILVDMTKQGAMGSVAPFIGAVANKTGESLATVFSKGNPTAIQKSFSVLAKAENKTLNAQSLMKDYFSALDTPAFTKAQQVISKSSSFLTEVAGFTGYSTLEHIAEGLITGELDLDSIDLGEEFKGQIEGLGTLKTIARFIQMKKSGAIAKDVQNKALNDMTEQLKDFEITDIGGQYRILDKTNGKMKTFNSPEEAVNHLFRTMFIGSAVAKIEQESVEWRKMNIGGEEVEVAVTKNADGKETIDFSKARKLNANGKYENFVLTTERDLLSGESEATEKLMSREESLSTKTIEEVFEKSNLTDEQADAILKDLGMRDYDIRIVRKYRNVPNVNKIAEVLQHISQHTDISKLDGDTLCMCISATKTLGKEFVFDLLAKHNNLDVENVLGNILYRRYNYYGPEHSLYEEDMNARLETAKELLESGKEKLLQILLPKIDSKNKHELLESYKNNISDEKLELFDKIGKMKLDQKWVEQYIIEEISTPEEMNVFGELAILLKHSDGNDIDLKKIITSMKNSSELAKEYSDFISKDSKLRAIDKYYVLTNNIEKGTSLVVGESSFALAQSLNDKIYYESLSSRWDLKNDELNKFLSNNVSSDRNIELVKIILDKINITGEDSKINLNNLKYIMDFAVKNDMSYEFVQDLLKDKTVDIYTLGLALKVVHNDAEVSADHVKNILKCIDKIKSFSQNIPCYIYKDFRDISEKTFLLLEHHSEKSVADLSEWIDFCEEHIRGSEDSKDNENYSIYQQVKAFNENSQFRQNVKGYIKLLDEIGTGKSAKSIKTNMDIIFTGAEIKPEKAEDFVDVIKCIRELTSEDSYENEPAKLWQIEDYLKSLEPKKFVETFNKLKLINDKMKLDFELIVQASNYSEITDKHVNDIVSSMEGLTENNNDYKKRIISIMILEGQNNPERFNHLNKWLHIVNDYVTTDISVLGNTNVILNKIIFDDLPRWFDYDTVWEQRTKLYQQLLENKEMLEALKNHEYIVYNDGFLGRNCVSSVKEVELIKEEDIDPLDVEKIAQYQEQQKKLFAAEILEATPLDMTIEALFGAHHGGLWDRSALEVAATASKDKLDAHFDKIDKMLDKMKQNPDLYLNGEETDPNTVNYTVDHFFESHRQAIFKLFDIYDKDAIDLLMRKRIEDFGEYLNIMNLFDKDTRTLLRDLSNSETISGKPFLAAQKVEFIDLLKGYIDNNLSMEPIETMVKSGRVDHGKLNLDLFRVIMKNSGLTDAEIESIPNEKLVGWDTKYAHLLSKEINTERDVAFSDILRAGNFEPDFIKYIHDETNVYGQANAKTKAQYSAANMNYDKWIRPSKENEIHFISKDKNTEQLNQIATQITEDMNTLMQTPVKGFLRKQFPKFIKGDDFVIPNEYLTSKVKLKEFVNLLADTSDKGQLAQVWKRAQGNATNPDANRAQMAKNTLTILDHLNQRLDDISKVQEGKVAKTIDITIKMWDRNPQKDIFQGNYSTCCIGMGNGNGSAMPHFVLDSAYNMIELVDNQNGKTIGNALCYFIKGADGKPAFIIDNIEINNGVKPSSEVGVQLRNAMVEYAAKVSKEVTGADNTNIYMSNNYNDVPTDGLASKTENISFLGDIDCDEIYMDLYDGWTDKDEFTSEQTLYILK